MLEDVASPHKPACPLEEDSPQRVSVSRRGGVPLRCEDGSDVELQVLCKVILFELVEIQMPGLVDLVLVPDREVDVEFGLNGQDEVDVQTADDQCSAKTGEVFRKTFEHDLGGNVAVLCTVQIQDPVRRN